MLELIDYINNIDLFFDRSEDWKLIGYWPKIMEKIYLLDVNMETILKKEPIQCYLDASLYNTQKVPIKMLQKLKRRYQYNKIFQFKFINFEQMIYEE